jgi:hypothetical protein
MDGWIFRYIIYSAILQSERLFPVQVDQQEMARRVLRDVDGDRRQPMGCCDVTECRVLRSGGQCCG